MFTRAYADCYFPLILLLAFAETWGGGNIQRKFMVKVMAITRERRFIVPYVLNTSSAV